MASKEVVSVLTDKALEMRIHLLKMCAELPVPLHIGGDLSITDVLVALYFYKLELDPKDYKKASRDRFILSKGHCAAALYVAMAMRGYFSLQEVFHTYGKIDSRFGMHPCKTHLSCLETSSGSLGHGLPIGLGMAKAARMDGHNHRVYVLIGDGECDEGSIWEAAMAGTHFQLGNLVAIVDRNRLQLDGNTCDVMSNEPFCEKWEAFGWNVIEVADGNDMGQLVEALDAIPEVESDCPTVLVLNTIKGKGVGFMENNPKWHAGSIDRQTMQRCIQDLTGNDSDG